MSTIPTEEIQRDPALDPSKQHHHPHIHHTNKSNDNVTYTVGTTVDPPLIPAQSPLPAPSKYEKDGLPSASDEEKGSRSSNGPANDKTKPKKFISAFYWKYKIFFHIFYFSFFTGWWIAGLVLNQKRERKLNWLILFLFWLAISLRLLFFYVPISIIYKPMNWTWNNTAVKAGQLVPEKLRIPGAAAVVVAVFLIGSFVTPESEGNTRDNRAVSLFGLLVFIFALWATSRNRKAIQWHTVIVGMLLQFIIALFVLRTKAGFDIFDFISGLARSLLGFTREGTKFLTNEDTANLTWFLIGVIPAIIFIVAFVQMLYHWGFIQWFIGKFAVFFFWAMKVSGAEAVVAAASPFIGQGESVMLIRPFIPHLTQAELHQVMCSGFATIAGSVLVAYIGMGLNPQALISSCVMSIPASLAISKLRYPEEEESLTAGRVVIPDDTEHKSANSLHAFAEGAWLGLKIGGMIAATLLCILALLGLANGLLRWWGSYLNIDDLSLEMIFGYICYPIAFLLGVPRNGDLYKVGKLIGIKIIANEFVAYDRLQYNEEFADISPRSRLIATYALCGFANIGSLGTLIGVLSQIAPSRSRDVSRLAVSALLSGAISTLTSASVAGLVVTDKIMDFVKPATPRP
ncbi:Na+ dependent nucleoside transporter C-terminus-domain-containing protein [Kalaharituber pfeilii]|nr:Na+ dependent nucleoside transporter C-terminus-domain-containing protein [Kalaharituber pfeilii]